MSMVLADWPKAGQVPKVYVRGSGPMRHGAQAIGLQEVAALLAQN